jgi:DNA-binding transcriptional LysR family regulator
MSMDLGDAALFALVADTGGFRAAAAQRGLSASSLSDAVRRLEDQAGVRLLNRTTRSVTPTEAGRQLLERLRPALREIDDALASIGRGDDGPAGVLRIEVPGIVARHVLPPIAAGFLVKHPAVRLDVTVRDNFVDVLAAGCDAGVRYEESIARDMIAVPIGPRRQRFVGAASRAYLAANGHPAHPSELSEHSCIVHRFANGNVNVWEFEREGESVRVRPEGRLVAESNEVEVAAAVAGLGVIFTFEEFVAAELARGTLAPVLPDWWQSFSGPFLYYQSRRHMPPPLRAFVDYIKRLPG